MRPTRILAVPLAALLLPGAVLAQTRAAAWDSVAAILQTTTTTAAGYYRYNLPRTDLTVRVGDVTVATALAAGAWAGFAGEPGDAVVMGDLVLTADELGPVLLELGRQGLDATAIHNHLAGESPEIIYVHFHGTGSATDLARRLRQVVSRTRTSLPVAAASPGPPAIDTTVVFAALGHGRVSGPIAQVSLVLVPDSVTLRGRRLVPALAYGTPINIQAVGAGRAVASGDFALLARSVAPVLRALAAHGITATALHTHLVDTEPVLYYIHFWADGPLPDVVAGLRAVVDAAR